MEVRMYLSYFDIFARKRNKNLNETLPPTIYLYNLLTLKFETNFLKQNYSQIVHCPPQKITPI